jgi:hypothetical protein
MKHGTCLRDLRGITWGCCCPPPSPGVLEDPPTGQPLVLTACGALRRAHAVGATEPLYEHEPEHARTDNAGWSPFDSIMDIVLGFLHH